MFWAKCDYITCAGKDWQKVHRKYVEQRMIEDEDWQNARKNIKPPRHLRAWTCTGQNTKKTKKRRLPPTKTNPLTKRSRKCQAMVLCRWEGRACREDQERRLRMEGGSESCLAPLKQIYLLKQNNLLKQNWNRTIYWNTTIHWNRNQIKTETKLKQNNLLKLY